MNNFFGPITQIGYLTNDIETTARAWTQTSGIGPWTIMRGVTLEAIMDGAPSAIDIDVALAYKGDQQIELIKPRSTAPSPYLENQSAGLWGLHHLQFETSDMDAAIALARTHELDAACTIDQGGGRYTYLRGPGIWFELIEASEGLRAFFQSIKDASIDWDGHDPVNGIHRPD